MRRKEIERRQNMAVKTMGVMLDCSRNGVMKPEQVKRFAKLISDMGYNMLQLYTEDTYEIDGEPFFGHMRGRYSQAELKDIDTYCSSIGIELIPCIQVLAHLNQLPQWKCYESLFKVDEKVKAEKIDQEPIRSINEKEANADLKGGVKDGKEQSFK